MSAPRDLAALSREVATEAAALVREHAVGGVEVAATKSSDVDVVTAADRASEELLRARLKPASGGPTLFVHAACERLIESLERYRYPADQPESTTPLGLSSAMAAPAD